MTAPALRVRRVTPGEYLVNDRYIVRRIAAVGGLYDRGPAWYWRDGHAVGVGSPYLDSERAALASLLAFLDDPTT